MSWNIRYTNGLLGYQRLWDTTEQTIPGNHHNQRVLEALEALDAQTPDWYFGAEYPGHTNEITRVWAQLPGETAVQAATVEELREKVREARTQLGV
ncbi:hypothetical protein [Nocardiopsis sp. FR26]|uniref:hypothetical protein n=1 Tax=Nocardiopsis sp. FR26 TaxID=2605987 RepID=UPI001359E932|nr:hypothetical protein [Nocardiopsis sp. FR26]